VSVTDVMLNIIYIPPILGSKILNSHLILCGVPPERISCLLSVTVGPLFGIIDLLPTPKTNAPPGRTRTSRTPKESFTIY
jgi:hypothetical protein